MQSAVVPPVRASCTHIILVHAVAFASNSQNHMIVWCSCKLQRTHKWFYVLVVPFS